MKQKRVSINERMEENLKNSKIVSQGLQCKYSLADIKLLNKTLGTQKKKYLAMQVYLPSSWFAELNSAMVSQGVFALCSPSSTPVTDLCGSQVCWQPIHQALLLLHFMLSVS